MVDEEDSLVETWEKHNPETDGLLEDTQRASCCSQIVWERFSERLSGRSFLSNHISAHHVVEKCCCKSRLSDSIVGEYCETMPQCLLVDCACVRKRLGILKTNNNQGVLGLLHPGEFPATIVSTVMQLCDSLAADLLLPLQNEKRFHEYIQYYPSYYILSIYLF